MSIPPVSASEPRWAMPWTGFWPHPQADSTAAPDVHEVNSPGGKFPFSRRGYCAKRAPENNSRRFICYISFFTRKRAWLYRIIPVAVE